MFAPATVKSSLSGSSADLTILKHFSFHLVCLNQNVAVDAPSFASPAAKSFMFPHKPKIACPTAASALTTYSWSGSSFTKATPFVLPVFGFVSKCRACCYRICERWFVCSSINEKYSIVNTN